MGRDVPRWRVIFIVKRPILGDFTLSVLEMNSRKPRKDVPATPKRPLTICLSDLKTSKVIMKGRTTAKLPIGRFLQKVRYLFLVMKTHLPADALLKFIDIDPLWYTTDFGA